MNYEQLCLFDMSCPKIPEEYIGDNLTHGGITKTVPRRWTQDEISWCLWLQKQGWGIKEIAESVHRDLTSVSIKLKRLKKSNDTYNYDHLSEKYLMNDNFYECVHPKSILDVYSGKKHYWKDKAKEYSITCISNDIDADLEADFHLDSLKLLCQEYLQGNKYDLIDIDPYGSAYDCFDLALKLAKKAIIITYGEMGHKRWKRLDYVRNTYQINNIEQFTIENLISKTQEIARHNHKALRVWQIGRWKNIARVYFTIEPLKITEQWELENAD